MAKQSRVNIKQYIQALATNKDIGDIAIYENVKELIYDEYGATSDYIQKNLIEPIDRQIEQFNKYSKNIPIEAEQVNLLIDYIETILENKEHLLHKEIKTIVNQNSIDSCWIDEVPNAMFAIGILQNILTDFHIMRMYNKDEKQLMVKPRDIPKINKAIELLSIYSDDVHLLHHLESLKYHSIDKTFLLGSFFYHYTQILLHNFKFTKSQSKNLAQEIMSQIFNSQKEYRIYTNTKSIKYKDLTLTRYIEK